MSGKVHPLAAFCEEYDEDSNESLPQTRQVANRLSLQKTGSSSIPQKGQHSQNSPDGASDSGYSSRTFASSQSALSSSGAKSPPLTLDSTSSSTKTTPPLSLSLSPPLSYSSSSSSTTVPTSSPVAVHKRPPKSSSSSSSSSSRKDPHRRRRSARDVPAIMQVGSYPSGPYHGSSNRSPSRSRGGPPPPPPVAAIPPYGAGWDYDPSLYHHSTGPSTPIEPLDYSYYLPSSEFGPPGPPPPPPMPPSTQTSRYSLSGPPPSSQDPLIVPHSSSRPSGRSGRANTYQSGTRPLSFHGGSSGSGAGAAAPGGGGFYNPAQFGGRYDYGPPLSASAYSHSPSFGPSAYGPQPPFYSLEYGPQMPDQPQPQPQPHRRDRSMSRSRDYPKARRSSMYGPPLVDNDPPTPTYDDGEPLERGFSRDSRPPPPMSPTSSTYDHNDDYYRMPPPPIKHHKSTSNAPQIIQKRPEPRKMATSTAVPRHEHRRNSKSFDMTDMDLALPDRPRSRGPRYQRSRENLVPERSRSIRNSRRPSHRDPSTLPSRLAVEGARRRRAAFYHYDDYEDEDDDIDDDDVVNDEDDDDDDENDEIEEKQREAEQYQAAKIARNSSNKPTPLTEHALQRTKSSRTPSDSSSQKSHSNSSRASDARTHHSCSHVGSNAANSVTRQQQLAEEAERNKNITMTMNGVTMSFNQESVGGKKISLRAGDTGALELNIGGGKKPKKYLTSGSEYGGTVARREIEDARRPRDGRRSEKASRRSSRSTYSGRFLT